MAKIILTDEAREKAEKFFDEAPTVLSSLYARWQEEKEHEDFNDYKAAAKKICDENGVAFNNLKKQPFELFYTIDGFKLSMRFTSKMVTWFILEAPKPVPEKLFMAYNQNGTELLPKPLSEEKAYNELKAYTFATGNAGSVQEWTGLAVTPEVKTITKPTPHKNSAPDAVRAKTDKKWAAYRPQIKGKLLKGTKLSKGEEAVLASLTTPEWESFHEMVDAAKAAKK